jgi:prepilin-type processing-associated H-X9-DG protein
MQIWGDARVWWDIPASRHAQGCNLSFADGHVERKKWKVPKIYGGSLPQPVPDAELPDYRWMQDRYRQSWN